MNRELDFVDECYKNKDLSLLKKLTLVIPTYNRNYYLSRCLWYHAHFPFGQIIVADSSPDEKKDVNRKTIAKIREMFDINILYLEYQPESEKYGSDIYRKWADAVYHAICEYTKICTDKELIIPSVLSDCISFLETNPDYNTADGTIFSLGYNKDKLGLAQWVSNDKAYDESDAITRICSLPRNSLGFLTSVRRTGFQKWIYHQLERYDLIDIRFGDMMPSLLSILCSKRYHDPSSPYIIRDELHLIDNKKRINKSESSDRRYPSILRYFNNNLISLKIDNLSLCLSNLLTDMNIYSPNKIDLVIRKIMPKILIELGINHWNIQKHFITILSGIYSCYYVSPQFLKNMIFKLLHHNNNRNNYYPEVNLLTSNKTIQIITTIIVNTDTLFYADEPLPLEKLSDRTNIGTVMT